MSTVRHRKVCFSPVSLDKRPFSLSNFGISSIILFFLVFVIDIREKNSSNVTTILLIVGGALIGTTVLGVSVMDRDRWTARFLTVSVIGYVIMGV